MPFRKPICLLMVSALVAAAGCSSARPLKGWNRWLAASDKTEVADPLAGQKADLSDEFKTARKSLEEPDKAQLAFARWKEDMGQYPEALQRYQEILTADPDNLSARLGIARIEFAAGRSAEAQKILQAAAVRSPNSPEVWIELGRIHAKQESWNEAIASFQKASDINATDQVARYELGIAYARAGHMTEAVNHLNFAVGEAAAMYNVGFVLHEQNRPGEAATWFNRALAAHPDERTKSQAERMLARSGMHRSHRNVSQSSTAEGIAGQFVQTGSLPAIRPSSGAMPQIMSQQSNAAGQTFAPHPPIQPVAQPVTTPPVMVRQPGIVKQASSSTSINGVPMATAEFTAAPQAHSEMPAVMQQPSMPIVTSATRTRVIEDAPGDPPQWSGPKPATTVSAPSTSNSAVEPEPWRPGR